jgi:hypothetical protein
MLKRVSYVYNVPSATFHYTKGDTKVYTNFVDRNTTIGSPITGKRGKYLLSYVKKYGYQKVTFSK